MTRGSVERLKRVVSLIGILWLVAGCGARSKSSGVVSSLEALRSSLRTELRERPQETWKILHATVPLAASCSEGGLVLEKLLALAPFIGNAEFNEFLSGAVDRVILSNASCFLDAWERLSEQEKDWVATLVAHPITATEESLQQALQESARPDIAKRVLDRARSLADGSRPWPTSP